MEGVDHSRSWQGKGEPVKKAIPAELTDLSVEDLLITLWKKMHAEEPVQPRTSFS